MKSNRSASDVRDQLAYSAESCRVITDRLIAPYTLTTGDRQTPTQIPMRVPTRPRVPPAACHLLLPTDICVPSDHITTLQSLTHFPAAGAWLRIPAANNARSCSHAARSEAGPVSVLGAGLTSSPLPRPGAADRLRWALSGHARHRTSGLEPFTRVREN